MFFDTLQSHLAVCAQPELPNWLRHDPDFWHVISIREPYRPLPDLRLCKRHVSLLFEDREELDEDGRGMLVQPRHLRQVFEFVDASPGAPVLVHCWAGLSRSTAVAAALLVRGLRRAEHPSSEWAATAIDQLLSIRPRARPNLAVLRTGLEHFLPAPQARAVAEEIVNDNRLLLNRFHRH